MSVRLARLLPAALIGASVATTAFAASQTLVWRGDVVTAHSVVDGMAKAWQKAGKGRLEVQPFNTASGLDAVSGGSADLAGSVRGSSGSAEDDGLTFTPVAWDGLVIITSPSNPVSGLTLKQLHDIYYGKIHNWSEVGGPNAPIDVYAVASPGDGVEYSLRRLLFGRGNQPVAAPRLYLSTTSLEQGIALDPHSLGVTTLSSAAGNRRLKMLQIDGSTPSTASVSSGSYPLFTPIYLVTRSSSPKAAEAQAFVDFTGSAAGKAVLRQHHLVPYADGAVLASLDTSRRARILAEVGARAPVTAPARPPISAPGATYASRSAIAPTSPRTLEAREALARRNAAAAGMTATTAAANPATPSLTAAHGSVVAASSLAATRGSVVAAPAPQEEASLKGVRGDAVTVADAASRGGDFARVRSDSYVSHDRAKAPGRTRTADRTRATAGVATYKVAAGETLYSIARKHHLDVAQIRNWNHLADNTVHPGQVLRLGAR
ncbi:substrate-binding domain-containing protein [Fulvimonas sp. R45]|uniref:substrate-binding domain-containing protein n=1 Tax=Fulvimonas sp. R45 TaxID=3045937 RepID=UPI00265DE1C7|nr:substrate-binding domain-containing protein [Fulvimonas sp. R45]MDO1527696.1 substrate-binding domain-containing protein [Fulvimonas sp. R45]